MDIGSMCARTKKGFGIKVYASIVAVAHIGGRVCVEAIRRFLSDRLRPRPPWWLAIALLILASAITAGCLSSSEPQPTQIVPPRSPPPSEPPTPTIDTEPVNIVSGYVVGYVIGGGDTTPEGLLDAPRTFVYEVQRDDRSLVHVTYTAYPPSPFGDTQRNKIRLNFHAGTVLIGDYLEARGTYDKSTSTLTVAEEGDYIATYPERP